MSLFNFKGKKEEKQACGCACNSGETANTPAPVGSTFTGDVQSIKVLGAGCRSCHEQYENAKKAVTEVGLDIEVEYITDMEKVMTYGVMSMPAIVVNEKVVSAGKVLKAADVVKLLKKSMQ